MKLFKGILHWFSILCVAIVMNFTNSNASPLPITDNTSPPYLGVTEGSFYSQTYTDFYKWLNRGGPKQFMGVTLPGDTWNSISGNSGIFYVPNKAWMDGDPANRTLVVCTPMFPGPTDRSGPTTGTNPGPVTFAAGAAGTYNWAFQSLAQHLGP